MDSTNTSVARASATTGKDVSTETPLPDYVVRSEGGLYAGRHILVDLWDSLGLDDPKFIETTLCDAARAAGATVLHVYVHRFSDNGGISGVAVLAESHISIHTWPEWNYAAIDVFMCGQTDPDRSVEIIREAFAPGRIDVNTHARGRLDCQSD